MEKFYILLVVTVLSISTVRSQAFDWGHSFGSAGAEDVTDIETDINGNVIVVGVFRGTMDINPHPVLTRTLTSVGDADMFIAKYAPNGSLLWAFSRGSKFFDNITDVDTDSEGNIYVAGSFQDSIDFDPTPGVTQIKSAGSIDGFWAKYSPEGSLEYVQGIGNSNADKCFSIKANSNYIYIAGSFKGVVDFNPGFGWDFHSSDLTRDIFLSQFSIDGTYNWTKDFSTGNVDVVTAMDTDEDDNIYISGYFYGSVDFNPDAGEDIKTSSGNADGFLIKLDATGSYQWGQKFGSTESDYAFDVEVDKSKVYLAGSFSETMMFLKGFTFILCASSGGQDGILIQYNHQGAFQKVNSFGGTTNESVWDIEKSDNGSIYLQAGIGRSESDLDFSGTGEYNISSSANSDIAIAKYNEDLQLKWVGKIGKIGNNYCRGICFDDNEGIVIGGSTYGEVDLDPGASISFSDPNGSYDCMVVKLRPFNTDANIESMFVLESQQIIIDSAQAMISVVMPDETNLSSLSAGYELSEGAKLNPALISNLSDTVFTSVFAEDTTFSRAWTVVASFVSDCSADIIDFEIEGYQCSAIIDNLNHTVRATMSESCDITSLVAHVNVSEGAIALPVSGSTLDFSDTVLCTVLSKNKLITNNWKIKVIGYGMSTIENIQTLTGLKVYPNPASNSVRVNCPFSEAECSISNLTGQIVYSRNLSKGENLIEVSHLQSGIYLVHVMHNSERRIVKLVID